MIRYINPDPPHASKWEKYLKKSYQLGIFSNYGPCVTELESRLSEYLSTYVTTTTSGTSALTVALRALDIKSKVIIPSFTFAATALAVLEVGAAPIFADISPATLMLDPTDIENKMDSEVEAIIVVRPYGLVGDVSVYEDIAKKYNVKLILDSAASLGGEYDGERAGSRGDCETFSMHITKPFGIGEGGLISSNNESFISTCKSISNFGFENRLINRLGTNAKMSDFTAAIGLAVLDTYDETLDFRNELIQKYLNNIGSRRLDYFEHKQPYQCFPVYWHMGDISNVCDKLKGRVEYRRDYVPLHMHPFFDNPYELPLTEMAHNEIVCLPVHKDVDVDYIKHLILRG